TTTASTTTTTASTTATTAATTRVSTTTAITIPKITFPPTSSIPAVPSIKPPPLHKALHENLRHPAVSRLPDNESDEYYEEPTAGAVASGLKAASSLRKQHPYLQVQG
ncbi:hypothetical protein FOZ63_010794, partial [Perkinsus olseni]